MSHRVLVIDDEPHVLQVMKIFLSRAGFIVDTAANGKDGLALVRSNRPDAVITDFEMPRMNGREIVEQLLADEATSPSLIIIVTSRTDSELREWIARMGRIGFVEKPASPRRLVRYIETHLAPGSLEAAS